MTISPRRRCTSSDGPSRSRPLEDVALGRGSTLVVTGEPGIGKSALAHTLAAEAEARGARVGMGRAWEVGGAPTYWPWSQALSELAYRIAERDATLGRYLDATVRTGTYCVYRPV